MKNHSGGFLLLFAAASFALASPTLAQNLPRPVTVASAANSAAPTSAAPGAPTDPSKTLPTVKDLLQRFESVSGGHDVWSTFHTRMMKGLYQTEDASGFAGIQIMSKEPNKTLAKITLSNGTVMREVCNGKSAWLEDQKGGVHIAEGAALESRMRRANFNDRSTMLVAALTGHVLGMEKIGAHNTYVMEFAAEKNDTGRLYFDTETGFIVRVDDVIRREGADYKVETYLDDYRQVDGAYFPFRLRHVEKGSVYTLKLTQIRNNVPIDDSVFLEPATTRK